MSNNEIKKQQPINFTHRGGVWGASASPGALSRGPRQGFVTRATRPRSSARSAAVGARTLSLSRRGDPGGSPAIRPSPRLPTASSGTPTASPEVADSPPRVGSVGGREFRATGGSAIKRRSAPSCHFWPLALCFAVVLLQTGMYDSTS